MPASRGRSGWFGESMLLMGVQTLYFNDYSLGFLISEMSSSSTGLGKVDWNKNTYFLSPYCVLLREFHDSNSDNLCRMIKTHGVSNQNKSPIPMPMLCCYEIEVVRRDCVRLPMSCTLPSVPDCVTPHLQPITSVWHIVFDSTKPDWFHNICLIIQGQMCAYSHRFNFTQLWNIIKI